MRPAVAVCAAQVSDATASPAAHPSPHPLPIARHWVVLPIPTAGHTPTQANKVEVLVDADAKADFEASYWSGLLDAQGKASGDYY